MMEIVIDKNTNVNKEKFIIESLKKSIEEDKVNNDSKSLQALVEHMKVLDNLQNKNDLEITF